MILNTTYYAECNTLCLIATVTLEMVIHLNYVTGQDLLPQDTGKCNFKGSAVAILPFIRMSPKKWKQSKNVFENIRQKKIQWEFPQFQQWQINPNALNFLKTN